MGKKRIIKKTEEEVLKEKEKVEQALKKEVKAQPLARTNKARIYISSSYNNTVISLTDPRGNVLAQRSAGGLGFKGTKKGTAFAANRVAAAVSNVASRLKIKEIEIFVKGIGSGRDAALKALAGQGLEILSIKDVTPIPHNGCRPKKPRRV